MNVIISNTDFFRVIPDDTIIKLITFAFLLGAINVVNNYENINYVDENYTGQEGYDEGRIIFSLLRISSLKNQFVDLDVLRYQFSKGEADIAFYEIFEIIFEKYYTEAENSNSLVDLVMYAFHLGRYTESSALLSDFDVIFDTEADCINPCSDEYFWLGLVHRLKNERICSKVLGN